jgi:hypothetical protein
MTTANAKRTDNLQDEQTDFVNRIIFGLIREHLGIFLSILTVLAIMARIIWVAHGDTLTVTALVVHQGVGGLIVTLFAIGLPIVAGLTAALTAADLGEAIREEMPWRAQAGTLTVALVLALLTVPSKWMAVVFVFAGAQVVYALLARTVRSVAERNGRKVLWVFQKSEGYKKRVPALMLIVTILAISPALIFSDSMWLPKEKVFYGEKNEVGYVISGDGDFTHVVREADRSSFIIKTEEITQRLYCPSPSSSRPLLTEWFWPNAREYKC